MFVCTGNICRSPLAAALLRVRLDATDPGHGLSVDSAGVAATGGPVPPEVDEVASEFGIDLSAHRGRQLDPDEVAAADLVVGMARAHVREVALVGPGVFARTFTLRELVRRAASVGGRGPGEPLGAWVDRVGEGRRAADLLGASADDDVADPYGRSRRHYLEMAATLDELLTPLAHAVTSSEPTSWSIGEGS